MGRALEAEGMKNLCNARGSERLASKQGLRKWGKILICKNSRSWRQDKVPHCLYQRENIDECKKRKEKKGLLRGLGLLDTT